VCCGVFSVWQCVCVALGLECDDKGCVVCSVLQCVAAYCSVLQCVAESCRELQCVAVSCSDVQ